jgi:hypothetical protein
MRRHCSTGAVAQKYKKGLSNRKPKISYKSQNTIMVEIK